MFRAYISAYRRAIDFGGRSSRKDYWGFFLLNVVVGVLIACSTPACIEFIIDELLHGYNWYYFPSTRFPVYYSFSFVSKLEGLAVYHMFSLVPSVAVAVRRVHDRNLPWYYILIPCYNIILMLLPGDVGANNYGPNLNTITDSGSIVFSNDQKYCENCGSKLRSAGKSAGKNIAPVMLWVIAFISVIANIGLYNVKVNLNHDLDHLGFYNSELKEDVDRLESDNSKLEEDMDRLELELANLESDNSKLEENVSHMEEEIDYYRTHVALITYWNNQGLYHLYWCEDFQKNKSNVVHDTAHDIEYAEEIGYAPCPKCFGVAAVSNAIEELLKEHRSER